MKMRAEGKIDINQGVGGEQGKKSVPGRKNSVSEGIVHLSDGRKFKVAQVQKTEEHGGKKVSEEGEAMPSGLVGQATNFDLYSKRNGKGFKKRIYFIWFSK